MKLKVREIGQIKLSVISSTEAKQLNTNQKIMREVIRNTDEIKRRRKH